jgi:hypothetical protein
VTNQNQNRNSNSNHLKEQLRKKRGESTPKKFLSLEILQVDDNIVLHIEVDKEKFKSTVEPLIAGLIVQGTQMFKSEPPKPNPVKEQSTPEGKTTQPPQ